MRKPSNKPHNVRRRRKTQARKQREAASPHTMSVPDAGRIYLNMGRDRSYEAAAKGLIPTIPGVTPLRVPVRAMERLLETAVLKPAE